MYIYIYIDNTVCICLFLFLHMFHSLFRSQYFVVILHHNICLRYSRCWYFPGDLHVQIDLENDVLSLKRHEIIPWFWEDATHILLRRSKPTFFFTFPSRVVFCVCFACCCCRCCCCCCRCRCCFYFVVVVVIVFILLLLLLLLLLFFVVVFVFVFVVVLRLSLLSEFWENPEIYPNKHHLGGPKSPGKARHIREPEIQREFTSWGNGSWNPIIYKVHSRYSKWLGLGFLKPSTVFHCKKNKDMSFHWSPFAKESYLRSFSRQTDLYSIGPGANFFLKHDLDERKSPIAHGRCATSFF